MSRIDDYSSDVTDEEPAWSDCSSNWDYYEVDSYYSFSKSYSTEESNSSAETLTKECAARLNYGSIPTDKTCEGYVHGGTIINMDMHPPRERRPSGYYTFPPYRTRTPVKLLQTVIDKWNSKAPCSLQIKELPPWLSKDEPTLVEVEPLLDKKVSSVNVHGHGSDKELSHEYPSSLGSVESVKGTSKYDPLPQFNVSPLWEQETPVHVQEYKTVSRWKHCDYLDWLGLLQSCIPPRRAEYQASTVGDNEYVMNNNVITNSDDTHSSGSGNSVYVYMCVDHTFKRFTVGFARVFYKKKFPNFYSSRVGLSPPTPAGKCVG